MLVLKQIGIRRYTTHPTGGIIASLNTKCIVVGKNYSGGENVLLAYWMDYRDSGEWLEWYVPMLQKSTDNPESVLELTLPIHNMIFSNDVGKYRLEIIFEGNPGDKNFSAKYNIYFNEKKGDEPFYKGLVVYGARDLYLISRGELFKYVQTPD